MGKNLDRLDLILAFRVSDSDGNVIVWSEKSVEELLLHRKVKNGSFETLRYPLTEQGATDLDKEINRSVGQSFLETPQSAQASKPKPVKRLEPEPIDSDVLTNIASYFGQGMSKWNAAANSGILDNQEKEFNEYWKSLVEERKRMRGGR